MISSSKIKAYNEYLTNKSPHTKRLYIYVINDFSNFIKISNIQFIDEFCVQRYINKLSIKNSPSTVKSRLQILKIFLDFIDVKLKYKKISVPKTKTDKVKVLDNKFMSKYFNELKKIRSTRMKTLLLMLPLTGCRISELCGDRITGTKGLTRNDVEKSNGRLFITVTGKFSKNRKIPLNKVAETILLTYLKECDKNGLSMTDPLFDVSSDTVRQKMKDIGRKINVPWLSPHVMRHTFITNLITNKIDPKTVQEIVGHSNLDTTLRIYTHSPAATKINAVDHLTFLGTS